MAEQIAHDVVKEAQSVGDVSLIDAPAKPSNVAPAGNGQAHPLHGNIDAQQDLAADSSEESVQLDARARAEVSVAESTEIPIDETEIQVVAADASGGSDTDTSKDTKGAAAGHIRSNSAKKLTSFKSVSVTKNFLAKTVTTPTPKAGDKGKLSLSRLYLTSAVADHSVIARYAGDCIPGCCPANRSASTCRQVSIGRSHQDRENERCCPRC
jgi:hypothetical protein